MSRITLLGILVLLFSVAVAVAQDEYVVERHSDDDRTLNELASALAEQGLVIVDTLLDSRFLLLRPADLGTGSLNLASSSDGTEFNGIRFKSVSKNIAIDLGGVSVWPPEIEGLKADPKMWWLNEIDAPEAWTIRHSAEDIVVAVLDSGLFAKHPELAHRLWHNPKETANDGLDNDQNGYPDDVYGWNFGAKVSTIYRNPDGESVPYRGTTVPGDDDDAWYVNGNENIDSSHKHGTGVAGVIGADGSNGVGTSGVVWRVQLMPLVVTQGNNADPFRVADAIIYAVDNKADVINVSLATNAAGEVSETHMEVLRAAVKYANDEGVMVICAAGNNKSEITSANHVAPAGLSNEFDNVITVAGTDDDRNLFESESDGSNFSTKYVDLAAPGVNIYTISANRGEKFARMKGTSLAVPQVTGAVALLKAADPELSPKQIKALLAATVDKVDGLPVRSGGVLNLAKALRVATTSPERVRKLIVASLDQLQEFSIREFAAELPAWLNIDEVNRFHIRLEIKDDHDFFRRSPMAHDNGRPLLPWGRG